MFKRSKKSWPKDIADFHKKFEIDVLADNMTERELAHWLQLRIAMIEEELKELKKAHFKRDAEEVIDALIDISVFTTGTLDILRVDSNKAWDVVMAANMSKVPGIKPERNNPSNSPDLIKPDGWMGPNHSDNLGITKDFLQ